MKKYPERVQKTEGQERFSMRKQEKGRNDCYITYWERLGLLFVPVLVNHPFR